jgi:uncharacterized protein YjiS (DUF1127 family)
MIPQHIRRTLHRQRRRVRGLIDLIGTWRQRMCSRQALMNMSERSLRDFGVTHYDALYEARKPFWRA